MSFVSLLRKEIHWSRRNALVLVFLVLLVPVFFAGTSLLFQDVVPRNVPVAVVAEDDHVSDDTVEEVAGTIDSFTAPVIVDDPKEAEKQLERESVYGIVTVPPDMTTAGEEVTVTLTVDGTIVPFQSPSQVVGNLLEFYLDRLFDADVSTDREVSGELRDLPEYLLPTFLMTVVIFFAFTYVPYVLRREAAVLDRIRVEASLESLAVAKLVYLTALTLVPILVFYLTSLYYGYGVDVIAPGAVSILLLTFVLLASFSTTVMVLARFSSTGTFVNLVVMLGLLALSALAFPIGFFSTVRTTIAQLLPTHYAMIIVRSVMLKDADLTLFVDWIVMLAVLCLLSLFALKGAIVHYRRTT